MEVKLRFPLNFLNYYNCIVNKIKLRNTSSDNTIEDYDTPVQTIKTFYKNGIRVNKVVLSDDNIILESITKKINKKSIEISKSKLMKMADFKLDSIKIDLSTEESINYIPKKMKPSLYRYQSRYELDPLPLGMIGRTPSVLWRLDITEYGDSKKVMKKLRNYI